MSELPGGARGAGGSLAEVEGLGDARHGDAEQQVVAQLGDLLEAHAISTGRGTRRVRLVRGEGRGVST